VAYSDTIDLKDETYGKYLSVWKSVLWEMFDTNTVFQNLNGSCHLLLVLKSSEEEPGKILVPCFP